MLKAHVQRLATVVAFLAVVFTGAIGAAEKVVITVGSHAETDGEVKFLFKPDQGEPQEVTIPVLKGAKATGTARDVRKAFVLALGDNYEVEIVGKEKKKVAITSKSLAGVFELELKGNTVGGLALSIK